jgi:predicted amidophosphoribosyltransferase
MRHRCTGGCGRRLDSIGALCPDCLARLPDDLRMALDDTEEQHNIRADVRRWLRTHPAEEKR